MPAKSTNCNAKMKPKSNFFQLVYRLVAQIPPGSVMTYGQIAAALGGVYSAQLVGFAMSSCPEELPAHRVVNRKGEMAGGGIFGGADRQRAMLEAEGVPFLPAPDEWRIDLGLARYHPDKRSLDKIMQA